MIRRIRGASRPSESGYTLVELVVVMAILGIVLSGLTAVFVGGSNAEAQLNSRFQAQQNSRLALDRIRGDIHCASRAQAATINTYPALRLDVSNCNTSTTYDYWCVVSTSTQPQRYSLYRTYSAAAPTSTTCTSSDAYEVLVASNLITSSALTTNATPMNGLQTVYVDLKTSGDQVSNTKSVYELTDSIVARNSTRCSSTATGWVSGTSSCTIQSVP